MNPLANKSVSGGFTLVEMLVVIVAIGILSAIAIPSWLTFIEVYRLNTAQSQVYSAIREAQSQAKKQKLTWQASFRVNDNIVQWAVHPATLTLTNANWKNLDSNIRLDNETTLQISNDVRQIQFDYTGSIRKPPLGRITLASKYGGKAKRCVIVSTILGTLRTAKEHNRTSDGKYCY